MKTRTAIIGCGGMGRLFARELRKYRNITVADKYSERAKKAAEEFNVSYASTADAIRNSDEIIIATTPLSTLDVIDENRRLFTKNKTVYDISSVKYLNSAGVSIPEKLSGLEARTLSCHPMFGPKAEGFEGKNVILIPTNKKSPIREYSGFFKNRLKSNVIVLKDSDTHDKYMAQALALGHIIGYISAGSIKQGEMPLKNVLAIEGTTALVNRIFAEFVASSSTETYWAIQSENKYSLQNIDNIQNSLDKFRKLIEKRDYAGFKKEVESMREYFKSQDPSYSSIADKFSKMVKSAKK
jgi:prephenate dehydrogenase